MRSVLYLLILLSGYSVAYSNHELPELRLATSQLSSSTIALDIETEQALREQMECVLTHMKFKPRIETKPWNRIYHDLQRGQLDGFFSAIPRKQLDAYAEISVPLIVENWYWFWRPGIKAPESWQKGFRLGSILGSQQEKWLEEAGYKVSMTANHLPQLIKMLDKGRIDVILVDREHFLQAIHLSQQAADSYRSRFFRYMPLGAYFSEGFLQKHPGFLQTFNKQANQCSHQNFMLSDNERKLVEQKVRQLHQLWEKTSNWRSMIEAGSQHLGYTDADIKRLDQSWVNAFQSGNDQIPDQLTHTGLSQTLNTIKKLSGGIVTEIILTDERGLNLAITDITSDFYQGDEEKFIKATKLAPDEYYIDQIAYDASTRLFQVNVSFPLYDQANSSKLIGVMVMGIDIEKTLSMPH